MKRNFVQVFFYCITKITKNDNVTSLVEFFYSFPSRDIQLYSIRKLHNL